MAGETALALIVLALGCAPIALLIRRAGELVVFDVRDGSVSVRGAVPAQPARPAVMHRRRHRREARVRYARAPSMSSPPRSASLSSLERELGSPLPPLDTLDDEAVRQLAALLDATRARRARALEAAIARALALVPPLLRPAVRKGLGV